MCCALTQEGKKSPKHKGVQYADKGPLAHHAILQYDFFEYAPKALRNMIVRKVSGRSEHRIQPAFNDL